MHEPQGLSGSALGVAEATQLAFAGLPEGEIIAAMAQDHDAFAYRRHQIEPFLVATSAFKRTASSEPFAPPGNKTATLGSWGDGKKTRVQRARTQQRLFAV